MFDKSKRIICGIVVFLVFAIGAVSVQASFAPKMLNREVYYETKEYQEYYSYLFSLKPKSLIRKVNDIFVNKNAIKGDNIYIAVGVLMERINEFESSMIMSAIMDEKKDPDYRSALIQLVCENKDPSELVELISLLKASTTDENIRVSIIHQYPHTEDTKELLTELVYDDNNRVAYHSLNKLYNIDRKLGLELAYRVYEQTINSEENPTLPLKAALQILSYDYSIDNIASLKNGSFISKPEQEEFIDECIKIIENNLFNLKDSAFYDMCNIIHPKAIKYIMDSDNISNSKKTFAVNMNFLPLEYIITNDESENNILLFCKATALRPFEKFKEIIGNISTEKLSLKCVETIDSIKSMSSVGEYEIHYNYKLIDR